jgi:hypothetical protein
MTMQASPGTTIQVEYPDGQHVTAGVERLPVEGDYVRTPAGLFTVKRVEHRFKEDAHGHGTITYTILLQACADPDQPGDRGH